LNPNPPGRKEKCAERKRGGLFEKLVKPVKKPFLGLSGAGKNLRGQI
jgi:hypothetical protein